MTIDLNYNKLDFVPGDTQLFQVEEGLFFYFKSSVPQRLYARFPKLGIEGNDAILSECNILHIIAVNRNLFFNTANRKIFKAVTDEFGNIRIHFIRDLQNNETVTSAGICIRTIDGAKRAFRMADNPNNCEGIVINVADEKFGEIKGIHRRKLIYLDYCGPNKPASVKMEHEAIFIELPVVVPNSYLFAQDSSRFFVSEKDKVFIINTETEIIMPVLSFSGITDIRVIGVNNNAIAFTGKEDGTIFLMTANIPTDYFSMPNYEYTSENNPSHSNSDCALQQDTGLTVPAMKKKKKRCRFDDWQEKRRDKSATEEHEPLDKWQTEMSNSINDLLDKNVQLSQLIEDAKIRENNAVMMEPSSITCEMLQQFRESNYEMDKEINRLKVDNQQLGVNIKRTADLNREIEEANIHLNKEKTMMLREEKEAEVQQEKAMSELREEREAFARMRNASREAKMAKQEECMKILDENDELEKQLDQVVEENRKLGDLLKERNKILQMAKKKMEDLDIE